LSGLALSRRSMKAWGTFGRPGHPIRRLKGERADDRQQGRLIQSSWQSCSSAGSWKLR
jgi:hypothetical protein